MAALAHAKEVALPATDVHHLTAKASGVGYKLYVRVPRDYAASKERYPVLYLLDADYSFPIVRGIVQHLSGDRGPAGPSYGGLFTNWVLLTAPDTFTCGGD